MLVPPLLMILAGVLGVFFSVSKGTIGTAYLVTFAIAAIVSVLLVVPRGLVVTVAQIPIVYSVVTVLTAWFTGSFADPANGGATATTPTKARLITAAYPIIQYFPWLAALMVICSAIAVWRYLELTRKNALSTNTKAKEAKKRQQDAEATMETASEVRRHLTESDTRVERARRSLASDRPGDTRRPAADIIRAAEERRRQRAEALRHQSAQRRGPVAQPRPTGQESNPSTDNFSTRPARSVRPQRQERPERLDRLAQPNRPNPQNRPSTRGPQFEPNPTSRRPIQRPAPSGTEYPRRQAVRPGSANQGGPGRVWGADEWPPRQERPRHSMRETREASRRVYDQRRNNGADDRSGRREWGERGDRGDRGERGEWGPWRERDKRA